MLGKSSVVSEKTSADSCSSFPSSTLSASPVPSSNPLLPSSWVTFSFHLTIFLMGLASARRLLRVATAAWRLTDARSSSRQTAPGDHRCSRRRHGSVGLTDLAAAQTVDEGDFLSRCTREQFVYLRGATPST